MDAPHEDHVDHDCRTARVRPAGRADVRVDEPGNPRAARHVRQDPLGLVPGRLATNRRLQHRRHRRHERIDAAHHHHADVHRRRSGLDRRRHQGDDVRRARLRDVVRGARRHRHERVRATSAAEPDPSGNHRRAALDRCGRRCDPRADERRRLPAHVGAVRDHLGVRHRRTVDRDHRRRSAPPASCCS